MTPDSRPGTVRCADCDWTVAAVEAAAWRELAAHQRETCCGTDGFGGDPVRMGGYKAVPAGASTPHPGPRPTEAAKPHGRTCIE